MSAGFLPWCGTSYEKSLLLWHYFLSKKLTIWTFSQTNWCHFIRITIQIFTTSCSHSSVLPYNTEIVTWPQITGMSLHPIYQNKHGTKIIISWPWPWPQFILHLWSTESHFKILYPWGHILTPLLFVHFFPAEFKLSVVVNIKHYKT